MGAGSIPGMIVAAPPAVDGPMPPARASSRRLCQSGRLEGLDGARFVAVCAVAFLHSADSPELKAVRALGTFGVPFFIFASLYIQAPSLERSPGRSLLDYFFSRARRLLLPFVAWNLIYYAALVGKHVLISGTGWPSIDRNWTWVGAAYHLWFLPFLMLVTACTAVLHRLCAGRAWSWWSVVVGCGLGGIFLSFVPRPQVIADPIASVPGYFLLQGWKALPSVFFGTSLAWALSRRPLRKDFLPVVAAFGATLTALMLALQISRGYSRVDRTFSGLGWMLVALAPWRGAAVSVFASLGRLSYGMYLSHALFIEGLQTVFHGLGYRPSVALDVTVFAGAIAGSAALAAYVARSRRLAWLNGG